MMRYFLVGLVMCVCNTVFAEDIQRQTMTSCAYQAGTASEIQQIRQQEHDDWQQFQEKVKKMYKPTQGRDDLLAIAKRVYLQPVDTAPAIVHEDMFQACVARVQNTEPKV